jgi:DNA-binding beta-propeller fold protein YncE
MFSILVDNMGMDIQGNIYISDGGNARVTKWIPEATVGTIAAGGNGFGYDINQLGQYSGIYVTKGTLPTIWIADSYNHRIVKWTSPSTLFFVCGSYGTEANQFNYPSGIFVDESASNKFYVADMSNHRIQMWLPGATNGTTVAGQTGIYGDGLDQLRSPLTLIVDTNGIMFIADSGNVRIMKWIIGSSVGEIIVSYPQFGLAPPNEFVAAFGISFDSNGSLFVTDNPYSRIQKFEIFCRKYSLISFNLFYFSYFFKLILKVQ